MSSQMSKKRKVKIYCSMGTGRHQENHYSLNNGIACAEEEIKSEQFIHLFHSLILKCFW